MSRQCELLGLARSSFYYPPCGETAENLQLKRVIDEQYLKTPFYGSRRMTAVLAGVGFDVNRKRAQRLMREWAWRPSTISPGPRSGRPSIGCTRTCCGGSRSSVRTRCGRPTSVRHESIIGESR